MKCLYNISQSSESIHLSNIRTLEGLLPFRNYEYTGYMPWVGAGGQNIEHPHTLVILSSFFFFFFFCASNAFYSFIGNAQFRRATLFCDSSYYYIYSDPICH